MVIETVSDVSDPLLYIAVSADRGAPAGTVRADSWSGSRASPAKNA